MTDAPSERAEANREVIQHAFEAWRDVADNSWALACMGIATHRVPEH
jgi:hypothetical protein